MPVVRLTIGLLVTLLLGHWLLKAIRPGDLARTLAAVAPGPVATAFVLYAFTNLFRAARYRAVGVRLPSGPLLMLTTGHVFLNRILPARSGDLGFGVLVRKLGGGSFSSGTVGLVQARIADLLVVAAVYTAALVGYTGVLEVDRHDAVVVAGGAMSLTVAAYLMLGPLLSLAVTALRAVDRRRAAGPRWTDWLAHLDELARDVRHAPGRDRALVVGTSLGAWAFNFLSSWYVLEALGLSLPFAQAVLGLSVGIMASSLPITLIGSFGVLEAGLVLGLGMLGIERGVAAATSVGFSLVTLVFAGTQAVLFYGAYAALHRRAPEAGG